MSRGNVARTAKTKGVNASKLQGQNRLEHADQEPQALLTRDALVAFIDARMCPFCSKGPWKIPLTHISKIHGIGGKELRDMMGVPLSAKLTDPETSSRMSANAARRGSLTDGARAKGLAKRRQQGRRQTTAMQNASASNIARAQMAAAKSAHTRVSPIIEAWELSDRSYAAASTIAESTGVTRSRVVEVLRSRGYSVPDGRTHTERKRQKGPKKLCNVHGCGKVHAALGLCDSHYRAQRKQSRTHSPAATR